MKKNNFDLKIMTNGTPNICTIPNDILSNLVQSLEQNIYDKLANENKKLSTQNKKVL